MHDKRIFLKKTLFSVFFFALFSGSNPAVAEFYGSADFAAVGTRCGENQSQNLSSSEFSEISRIRYIHDGDTLHLRGGRKVRLIGINTPELARNNKPAEPYALQAKQALMALFSQDKTIALIYGKDKTDHYGRLLAHAFTSDGRNVQTALLERGLASAISIPPNTRYARCYLEAEQKARCARKGLWSDNGIIEAKDLGPDETGFKLVRGTVKQIDFDDKGIWLNLDDKLTVGIRPKQQHLFQNKHIKSLQNQTIIVRGWINKSRRKTPFYMRIKHPLDVQLASEASCPSPEPVFKSVNN